MAGIENNIFFGGGIKLKTSSADDIFRMQETSTDVSRVNYIGNPNGNISANPSSLCHDPSSGNVYFKQIGTDSNGWILLTDNEGLAWNVVTSATNPNQIAIENGYITKGASAVTLLLPAASTTGDT